MLQLKPTSSDNFLLPLEQKHKTKYQKPKRNQKDTKLVYFKKSQIRILQCFIIIFNITIFNVAIKTNIIRQFLITLKTKKPNKVSETKQKPKRYKNNKIKHTPTKSFNSSPPPTVSTNFKS